MFERFPNQGLAFFIWLVLVAGCQRSESFKAIQDAPQGWVSSGGEIFDDSQNPWFLDNDQPIRYCVEVDTSTFSASPDEVRRQIRAAIDYWKNEFASYAQSGGQMISPPLTRFEESACEPSTDLRFQMGWGALSSQSIEYLSHLTPHVSLAVRTQYDRVKLRGKGLIYLASDQGERRYPQGETFIDRPWHHPGLLWRTLVHELGHVLGLPHFGHGIMSAHYPERILKVEMHRDHLSVSHLGSVLRIAESYPNCSMDSAEIARRWFAFPAEAQCLIMKIAPTAKDGPLEVNFFALTVNGGKSQFLGQARSAKDSLEFSFVLEGFATLFLPPEQQIFAIKTPEEKYKVLFYWLTLDAELKYYPAGSGDPRELYLKVQPNGYQLLSSDAGGIHSLLSHRENCLSFPPFGNICSGL